MIDKNSKLYRWVLDPLERAGWSFGQQFAAVMLAALAPVAAAATAWPVGDVWIRAIGSGLLAGLISFVSFYLMVKLTLAPVWDLIVRTARTFGASLIATIGTNGWTDIFDVSWAKASLLAAIAAGIAFFKGFLMLKRPDTVGASSITVIDGTSSVVSVDAKPVPVLDPNDITPVEAGRLTPEQVAERNTWNV